MILTLNDNVLTSFDRRAGYSVTGTVKQSPDLSALMRNLLEWLNTQLAAGESVSDVVMESADDGVISAAVSVSATVGMRTFTICSESLPVDLREGLLSAWNSLNSKTNPTQ